MGVRGEPIGDDSRGRSVPRSSRGRRRRPSSEPRREPGHHSQRDQRHKPPPKCGLIHVTLLLIGFGTDQLDAEEGTHTWHTGKGAAPPHKVPPLGVDRGRRRIG
ncbi:hypothetical protein GCM10012286_29940 [Streptomyces lasiicapitis]|uniref:Uncharacterized protein n=1 Tax=Streptomyces lasiicapitis TaxID=1923961 RepID=A0ABQ2LWV0_9ACTN|nr:hypothetical protein GCM10012286_29940 [Streptomyces lasiicapitis]